MDNRPYTSARTTTAVGYDAGLRAHMQQVYNRMAAGVLITAVTAWIVSSTPALLQLFMGGPQAYIVIFAPLALIWFGFNPARMTSKQLMLSFGALSILYGISFSVLGVMFTNESIARAFFVASAMFAGLSIYGYTTKKSLDAIGSFCVMGVWGLLVASLLNLFFQSPMMQNVIAGVGIIAFAGITAWYTQMTKETYSMSNGDEMNSRMAWSAALNLYIAFIAMFQYILQFMGERR